MVLILSFGAKFLTSLSAASAVFGVGALIGRYHTVSAAHKAVKDEIAKIESGLKKGPHAAPCCCGTVASEAVKSALARLRIHLL